MEEIWKPISNYENYRVSNLGDVKNKDGHSITKQITHNGYLRVELSKKGEKGHRKKFRVHRLVGEAFVENPNNMPHINHLDGNKTNNISTNLEWTNVSGNMRHAYELGLLNKNRDLRGKFKSR